ncbi:MAG: 3-dehydroquinate synthase [Candidatus Omnitrophica bacterium]|nr:3-dehydroquinate synthase [Candidatus Omnitrophota bacterium]
MPTPIRVRVSLGARGYDVLIGRGRLERLGAWTRRLAPGNSAVIISNPTVLRRCGAPVVSALTRAGFPVSTLTIADTERAKSMATVSRLLAELTRLARPGWKPFLVLLGGGVVGDVGGMVAGLFRRGVPYLQLPTTLLAQVDSAIGGKTAVDLPQGKNLAGLFYQPRGVFIELDFLKTLPDRQFRSGLAEIAKCAVIRDPKLFAFLERTTVERLRGRPSELAWVIGRAVKVKARVVSADEFEKKGIRTVLNLGHTLGHALEAASHFSRAYAHGEAVALGMRVSVQIAGTLGLLSLAEAERIGGLLTHLGLPSRIRAVAMRDLLLAMSHDKKWAEGLQRWVLPAAVGKVVVRRGVPLSVVKSAIRSFL